MSSPSFLLDMHSWVTIMEQASVDTETVENRLAVSKSILISSCFRVFFEYCQVNLTNLINSNDSNSMDTNNKSEKTTVAEMSDTHTDQYMAKLKNDSMLSKLLIRLVLVVLTLMQVNL